MYLGNQSKKRMKLYCLIEKHTISILKKASDILKRDWLLNSITTGLETRQLL